MDLRIFPPPLPQVEVLVTAGSVNMNIRVTSDTAEQARAPSHTTFLIWQAPNWRETTTFL